MDLALAARVNSPNHLSWGWATGIGLGVSQTTSLYLEISQPYILLQPIEVIAN
jgi:hypothetical protein